MPEQRRDRATHGRGGILSRMATLLGTEVRGGPRTPQPRQPDAAVARTEVLDQPIEAPEQLSTTDTEPTDSVEEPLDYPDRIPESTPPPLSAPQLEEQLQTAVESARKWRASLEREQLDPVGHEGDELINTLGDAEQTLRDSLAETERRVAIEQRLSETLHVQRTAAQEFIEQAAQRAGAALTEADARVEVAEGALLEAQAIADQHATERADLEQRLASTEREYEELCAALDADREALSRAQQEAEEAQAALGKTRDRLEEATARIDSLEQSLAESRDETERERADRDALRNRLRALVEGPAIADAQPAGAGAGADLQRVANREQGDQPEQAADLRRIAEPKQAADTERAAEPEQAGERGVDVVSQPAADEVPGRSRRRRRGPAERPSDCWVCHRPARGSSTEALRAKGWSVEASASLCAACRSSGWKLPSGAVAPSRVANST